jgi:hypothetical protein
MYNRKHLNNSDNLNDSQLYSKEQENIQLKKKIAENSKKQAIYENKIDSLSKLKNKISIQYQIKENEIKNAYSFYVINQLDSIFTKNGVKRK